MKVAIVTLPLHTNYGGLLQAYALKETLQQLGHEVTVLDLEEKMPVPKGLKAPFVYARRTLNRIIRGADAPEIMRERRFKQELPVVGANTTAFISEYIDPRIIRSYSQIRNGEYDAFVVGSDQVWRPRYFPGVEDAFLAFTKEWSVRRVAYAASFGTDEWEYNDSETSNASAMAAIFNAISVRETSGIKLCQEYLGVEVVQVVDPTLLLSAEDYTKLFQEELPASPGNMMCYLLDRNNDKDSLVNDIANEKKLIPFHTNSRTEDQKATLEERIQPPVEQWLQGFRDAEFVVTDSFHACIFSILYKKTFVVIGNKNRGMTRFECLLQTFGLEDRLVISYEDYGHRKERLLQPIDYNSVFRVLAEKRDEAFKFLREALG
jgi:hypothetical protein